VRRSVNDGPVRPSHRREDVPIAVVGPPSVATQLDQLPGDPLDTRMATSRSDALSQIDDRKVYGAYDAATNRLFVASAANRATAIALERTFNRVAAAQGRPAVRVTDVKPLPPKDPNGTAAFYAVIAWVFGGYIGATLIGLIGTPRSRSHARAAARIGALAGFGVVAGILSVILLRACFGVFAGHVAALCAIAALTIFASGAATAGTRPRQARPGPGSSLSSSSSSAIPRPAGRSHGRCCRGCGGQLAGYCHPGRAWTSGAPHCSSTARGSRARFLCS